MSDNELEKTSYSASYKMGKDNDELLVVITDENIYIKQGNWSPSIEMSTEKFEKIIEKFYELRKKIEELK